MAGDGTAILLTVDDGPGAIAEAGEGLAAPAPGEGDSDGEAGPVITAAGVGTAAASPARSARNTVTALG